MMANMAEYFENESKVITEIEKEMEDIASQIKNSHVPNLQPKQI